MARLGLNSVQFSSADADMPTGHALHPVGGTEDSQSWRSPQGNIYFLNSSAALALEGWVDWALKSVGLSLKTYV